MKNNKIITYGFVGTLIIFMISGIVGQGIHISNGFITDTFATHTIMLILSIFAIFIFSKNVNYHIALPKFKHFKANYSGDFRSHCN